MEKRQIIAIGGGGFTKKDSAFVLEKYILAQTKKENPIICFLPQASNESPVYILSFYDTFLQLGAQPVWVSLFSRVALDWKEKIEKADVVFVGGGNTRSMLALWKEWGVDSVLKNAYHNGVIMAGISAGMICWFEKGITDSSKKMATLSGLNFLPDAACPHFDSEPEREPFFISQVEQSILKQGIALEDGVAAHYVNEKIEAIISEKEGKKAYWITAQGKKELPAQYLQ